MKHRNKIIVAIVAVALLSFSIRWYVENEVYSPSTHYQKTDQVKRWWAGLWEKKQEVPEIKISEPPKPKDYQDPIWPPSSTIDWDLRNQLSPEVVEAINHSPVPVLMPSDIDTAKKAKVFPHDTWYQSGIDLPEEPLIGISGEKINFNMSTWPATHEVRGNPGIVGGSAEKGIHEIYWIENGVFYSLYAHCGYTGCIDQKSINRAIEIVNNLTYTGGSEWNN